MPGKKPSKKRERKQVTGKPSKLELSSFGIGEGDHDAFKAAVSATAKAGVDEFPGTLERLTNVFRDRFPLSVLSSVAMYSLHTSVTSQGLHRDIDREIEQHHIELLQAVMLMVPAEEWGSHPLTADVVQDVFDNLPKLAQTFLFQRLRAAESAESETTKTLLSLQDRIRLHTQVVRNWGYYNDVISISKDIYAPLDNEFADAIGFSVSDLVDVMNVVVNEYENRTNEHFSVLRKVFRGKTVHQFVRLYYKYVQDLNGTPEELITSLPPEVNRDGMFSLVMQHFDLRLHQRATFTAEEISALSGRPKEVVEKILRVVSRPVGDLVSARPDHLFLANPVWTAPGVEVSGGFFFAIPQAVFSHINAVVHGIAEKAGLTVALERRRARFLESKLEEIIRKALPGATITSNVEWQVGEEQGETDILVVLDRVVLVGEAKSHHLTPQGLRGAPERMKRHIQDMVVASSVQSARLEELIGAARKGDAKAIALMARLGIDAAKTDRVIRVSVTLDDLSVLSSAEAELKAVGWVPAEHHLSPTIHIADLACIVDILNNPLLLLHYLSERAYLQRTFDLLGDELDFLGLYLSSQFNLGSLEGREGLVSVSGMSGRIDRYYESRDAGIRIPKPKADLQPLYRSIIERLCEQRGTGWIMSGVYLLGSANPVEQQRIEGALNKLRASVRKEFRDPGHRNSVVVQPASKRKACVVFYLFPEQHRAHVKKNMEQFAARALAEGERSACVVFGRCIDDWRVPYEAVLLVQA